jgi:hypothetical protein
VWQPFTICANHSEQLNGESPLLADSVEKIGFSDRLNSGATTTGENGGP